MFAQAFLCYIYCSINITRLYSSSLKGLLSLGQNSLLKYDCEAGGSQCWPRSPPPQISNYNRLIVLSACATFSSIYGIVKSRRLSSEILFLNYWMLLVIVAFGNHRAARHRRVHWRCASKALTRAHRTRTRFLYVHSTNFVSNKWDVFAIYVTFMRCRRM